MTITELRDKTSKLKIEKQSFINDTYMWVQIARDSIRKLPNSNFQFATPKAQKPQELRLVTRRDPERLKNRIVDKDIFNSAFVIMVASVEDYFSKIIEYVLKTDNRRLKCTIPDVKMINTISVIDLIDNSKDDLIDYIIAQRLNDLFYASPRKQLEYINKALGIDIEKDVWETWIEIKARRDIIIHNNGIVNEVYLGKTKNFTTYSLGQYALVDDIYFKNTVAQLKHMIGGIDREIRKIYTEE